MLEVDGLRVRYGGRRHSLVAVDGVDLAVPRGGTLGLVGESGSGKSSLARALVGLAPLVAGSITLDGQLVTRRELNSRAYRRRVQLIFQDPHASLNPRMTIGKMIDEALALRGLDRRERRPLDRERTRILDLVGLPATALSRYPNQFSGGQRQRIAIARALALEPEVIIADEVTSALDVSIQASILNLLKELQRELGLSMLFISHDLAIVEFMSDQVAVMYLARIVERAAAENLFAHPMHPYTKALIRSIPEFNKPRPDPLRGDLPDPANPPRGCRFHTRCPEGVLVRPERALCVTTDPADDIVDGNHLVACHYAAATNAPTSVRNNAHA